LTGYRVLYTVFQVLGFGDSLGGNSIGDEGISALAAALGGRTIPEGRQASRPPAQPRAAPALVELGLANNRVGDVGARALAGVLAAGAVPALARLSVAGNRVGDEAVCELARARPALRADCGAQNPVRARSYG